MAPRRIAPCLDRMSLSPSSPRRPLPPPRTPAASCSSATASSSPASRLRRPPRSPPGGLDDFEEVVGLEARPADEAAIDIGLREQALGVVRLDAAAVEDGQGGRELVAVQPGHALADVGLRLLRLLRGGSLAGAD